jgi:hypothetical protein
MTQPTTFADLSAEAQRVTLTSLKQAHELSIRGAELATGLRDTGTRGVPSPKETVEGAFAFASGVLQQQKAYALRMTEILTGAAPAAAAKTK